MDGLGNHFRGGIVLPEFEWVPKIEYQPVRNELETIIHRVQNIMRKEYGITFQYRLIGSGSRHLITRAKGGNKGFDLDYNLILPLLENGRHYKPKEIADRLMQAFTKAIQGTAYGFPKDRTSVIRLRRVDQQNKKVLYGCDFAVIYYDDEHSDGYKYLKHWDDGHYSFEKRKQSRNADWKLDDILEYSSDGWNWIREEYLKLKCNNRDSRKRSYVLYLEAIHNVYNQIQQCECDEEE